MAKKKPLKLSKLSPNKPFVAGIATTTIAVLSLSLVLVLHPQLVTKDWNGDVKVGQCYKHKYQLETFIAKVSEISNTSRGEITYYSVVDTDGNTIKHTFRPRTGTGEFKTMYRVRIDCDKYALHAALVETRNLRRDVQKLKAKLREKKIIKIDIQKPLILKKKGK